MKGRKVKDGLGTVSKARQNWQGGIKRTREDKKDGEGRAVIPAKRREVHGTGVAHYTGKLSGERSPA
jgi:hypothetical protein